MSLASAETVKGSARPEAQSARGRLFRKYVALLVGLVAGVLIISGGLSIYFTYQREKSRARPDPAGESRAAAAVIRQFIEEIQTQIGWTTQLSLLPDAAGLEQRRIDYYRLLRQAPAITEIAFVDGSGKEQLRVSRLAMDVAGSQADLSDEPAVRTAHDTGAYFGPVYFRKESEPYMTLAVRGSGKKGDVTIAEINLKFIRDVISGIRVGKEGYAYVVDAEGRLVAHPDLALVLRKTDLSSLPQVARRDRRARCSRRNVRPDRDRDRPRRSPGAGRARRDRAAQLARLRRDAARRGVRAALHEPALERRPAAARTCDRRPGEPVARAQPGRPDPGAAGGRHPHRPGRSDEPHRRAAPATSCSRSPSSSIRWRGSCRNPTRTSKARSRSGRASWRAR